MSTQLFTVPSEISKLRLNHVMSHHPERINLKLISWRKDCNLTRQILSHHSFNHWKTLRSIFSHSPYPSSILNYWSRAPQNILTSSDFLIKLHCNLATSPKLTSPFPKPHPPGSRPPISRQTRRDAKHRLRKPFPANRNWSAQEPLVPGSSTLVGWIGNIVPHRPSHTQFIFGPFLPHNFHPWLQRTARTWDLCPSHTLALGNKGFVRWKWAQRYLLLLLRIGMFAAQ